MAKIAKIVYLCFSKLKQNLEKMSTDSNVLSFLKKEACNVWEKSLKFQIFVCWLCFLIQSLSLLRSPDLTNDDKKRIHDLARLLRSDIVLPPSVIYIDREHSYGQPSKRSKTAALEDKFFDWQCDDNEIGEKR